VDNIDKHKLHELPGPHEFKIIGDSTEEYHQSVMNVFYEVLGKEKVLKESKRESTGKIYIAYSVEAMIYEYDEILEIRKRCHELSGTQIVL